jgi:2-succinyl-6-hydroxy-2,4-cyclohexadiene-1-carboxylate synthase
MTLPRLLLLHGFTGSGESWADHEIVLATSFETIAVDLPGHGASQEALSVEATADELAIRADGRPLHVLGYSFGARIALRLAVSYPDVIDRLVLESPSAGIADRMEREARRRSDEQLADDLELGGIEAFVDRWERHPVFASHLALDPEMAARQRAIRLAQDPHRLAASLRLAGQGAMEPLHGRLAEVASPTLVIAGALDSARPRAEQVAAGIPGARLEVVDGAGHTPHLEQPEEFRRLVIDFLQEDSVA